GLMSDAAVNPLNRTDQPGRGSLSPKQRDRVRSRLVKRRNACGSCGNTEFEIGKALYLGFLWLSEHTDAYMIALTCTNPECAAPRTGIRLREGDFLGKGEHLGIDGTGPPCDEPSR